MRPTLFATSAIGAIFRVRIRYNAILIYQRGAAKRHPDRWRVGCTVLHCRKGLGNPAGLLSQRERIGPLARVPRPIGAALQPNPLGVRAPARWPVVRYDIRLLI
jgi:hypothetical protein